MHVLRDAEGLPLVVGVSAADTHTGEGLHPMAVGEEWRLDRRRSWREPSQWRLIEPDTELALL